MFLIAAIVLELVGITVLTLERRQETSSSAGFDPSSALEFVDEQDNPLVKKDNFTYEVSTSKVKVRLKTQQ